MKLVPGALIRIRLHPNVEQDGKKDVLVFDARFRKQREFLDVGTQAMVIGINPIPGMYPDVYLFVPERGFYRTNPMQVEVLWSPCE